MSLDSNRFPLKELPFPAITICNVNKVSKRSLLKVLEEPRSVEPHTIYRFHYSVS